MVTVTTRKSHVFFHGPPKPRTGFGGGGGAYEVASTPTPPHWTQPATATAGLCRGTGHQPLRALLDPAAWILEPEKKSEFQEEYENDMNVYLKEEIDGTK